MKKIARRNERGGEIIAKVAVSPAMLATLERAARSGLKGSDVHPDLLDLLAWRRWINRDPTRPGWFFLTHAGKLALAYYSR